jgi:hypothetical protein
MFFIWLYSSEEFQAQYLLPLKNTKIPSSKPFTPEEFPCSSKPFTREEFPDQNTLPLKNSKL